MSAVRDRGEAVRKFIIGNLEDHPTDIVRLAAERFGCTRQAVHKHLQRLIAEGTVTPDGQTRNKTYKLAALVHWEKQYLLGRSVTEDHAACRDRRWSAA